MLIIPKIISYERAHNLHVRIGPRFDISAQINGVKSAINSFKVDHGFCPKGLQDLVQQSSGDRNWHGPYFDPPKLPVDPWGHPYIYEFPGKHNTNGYDLFSAGPDGKAGTEDDIVNWTK